MAASSRSYPSGVQYVLIEYSLTFELRLSCLFFKNVKENRLEKSYAEFSFKILFIISEIKSWLAFDLYYTM